jgi:RNA polymerase sigma factor (sigma-70 family)
MNMTDGELLQRYVRDHSEIAFADLAKRHVNLVYSAALRQVNGSANLAEEVTQSVFTDLARKADQLVSHTSLTAWLYTSTRFIAANIRRTEQRRHAREQEAHAMNTILSEPESQPAWSQLSPLLDEAMHMLNELDREAVLLRHFENQSFAEIGNKIGLTENAPRLRVERALEKLHGILIKKGAVLTLVILAGVLNVNAVGIAPTHFATKVISGAVAGAATGGGSIFLSNLVSILKSKVMLAGTTAALLSVLGFLYALRSWATPENNSGRLAAAIMINKTAQDTNVLATHFPVIVAQKVKSSGRLMLHLKLVTSDSGKPIPNVPIEYYAWWDNQLDHKTITSNRFGECDVEYPTNTSKLELTTRKDGFADTRLLWMPSNGYVIPTNYMARIDRPVAIGGQVVDTTGNPIADAEVHWNYMEDPLPASYRRIIISDPSSRPPMTKANGISTVLLRR